MTPEMVYQKFCEVFPEMKGQIVKFIRRHPDDGYDYSIKVFLRNKNTLIFNLKKDGTWHLRR